RNILLHFIMNNVPFPYQFMRIRVRFSTFPQSNKHAKSQIPKTKARNSLPTPHHPKQKSLSLRDTETKGQIDKEQI
ncbi:MAG: hypothetical protein QG670_535, partial [Thermoproteota archaeon]|nr:hypothetical protein [Thermoproteota archaeon]